MTQQVLATYRDGVFEPESPCELPEGAEVKLTIQSSGNTKARVTDPEERRKIMDRLLKRMENNPIAEDAPKFNREALYDRS